MFRLFAVLLLMALSITPLRVNAAPVAQTLPEAAIPQATLASDWKVTSVTGPTGQREIYKIELEHKTQAVFAYILIGTAEDSIEAQALVESSRTEMQSGGFQLSPVPGGPGDGPAYRGIVKRLVPGYAVQLTVITYITRAGPRFTQISTSGIEVPEQTLYDINARLIAQQTDRFRAITPPPAPAPSPVATPAPAPRPLDARALALTPADLGPNWLATDTFGDARGFMTEYFNGTVDYSGFGIDRVVVEPLANSAAADARVQWWRDGPEGQRMTVAIWSGLGDGDAVRFSDSYNGLKTIGFVYRVGTVVVLTRATAAATSPDTTIETEALRVAKLEQNRIQSALAGQVFEPIAMLSTASLPDPTGLVLSAESLGDGWVSRNVDASGSAEQGARSTTSTYGNDTTYSAPRSAFLRVALAPDTARARVGLGTFIADGVAQNFQYVPVPGLGDEIAFMGTQVMDDGRTTVEYVYRVGPSVVSVALRAAGASVDELSQQAWDIAVAQQQHVLDILPTLASALDTQSAVAGVGN